MEVRLAHKGKELAFDLSNPLDISIPLRDDPQQVNCFWAPLFEVSPVRSGDFVGSTAEGGLLNFMNVRINPHGNGTHTECVGHISREPVSIHKTLRKSHFLARLITVIPQKLSNGDRCITRQAIAQALEGEEDLEALIIRTTPNDLDKQKRNYSGTNPVYMEKDAMELIVERKVKHLLIDLPSVDREEDGGALVAHNTFWNYFGNMDGCRREATITELIYVPDSILDGMYLLNLQTASFDIDVSPSKPLLYKML